MSGINRQHAEEAQRRSNSGVDPQPSQAVLLREPKSMGIAYVLWAFLGAFGVHRFYLDRTGSGAAQLILWVVGWATVWFIIGILPLAIVVVWVLVDLFLIPGMLREANQRRGIVYNVMTAPTGSYASPSDPTSYADTPKDASEGRARVEEEQQRQVTRALTTPTSDDTRHETLAAVSETVALSTKETLEKAQSFLTSLGYTDVRRVDNSLRAERHPPANGDEQRTFFLTVTAAPQAGGGVRVSVSGDDREGMLEHQAEWTAWSENLPKVPDAQINASEAPRTEEMPDVSQQPPPLEETIHFCSNCGHKARAGENFCPECGHKLHA